MTQENAEYSAAALYEGGWRSEDEEELRLSYNLTEEEAEEICRELRIIEEVQR